MFALSTALLCCAHTWAMDMLPVEGVYEKADANGNIIARLQAWDVKRTAGKEGQQWTSPTNYPYISLQLFEKGVEVCQIGTSYQRENDIVGTAYMAIVLDKEECAAVKASQRVIGKHLSYVGGFGWKDQNEVSVKNYSVDERFSGIYSRVDRLREIPAALLIYGYEANQQADVFLHKDRKCNLVYTFTPLNSSFNLQNFKIKNEQMNWEMDCYVEKAFASISTFYSSDNGNFSNKSHKGLETF